MPNHDLILTRQDIALIRAALRFWAEEMPGVPKAVTDAYFDDADVTASLEPSREGQLMSVLGRCRAGYALVESSAAEDQIERVYPLAKEAREARVASQRIATLLVVD